MKSSRTVVLALAAKIAWHHRDTELLLATLILGLRAPVSGIDIEAWHEWPKGAELLLRAYH